MDREIRDDERATYWYHQQSRRAVEDPGVLIRAKESKETDIKVSPLDTPQSSKQQLFLA